ncbi:MAG TPA: hypothetical protein VKT52_01235, partial [Ktedonobacterales bacterium]|nr:hypothetical protein [Ktedonobacterales bacterium]
MLLLASALVISALAVVGGILISTHDASGPVVHQTSISNVLTLADKHQVRSAVIDGNTVTVTATNGQEYSATKEDGQGLTQYLRDRGASVTVQTPDTAPPGWVQMLLELSVFALLAAMLFLVI